MSGSSNSNRFQPKSGPNAGKPHGGLERRSETNSCRVRQRRTTPPAVFNSQKYIYMTREYKRYNAGLIGHYDLNDNVQPYVEFGFMNDRTPSGDRAVGSVREQQPAHGRQQISDQLQQPAAERAGAEHLCTPAQIAADTATPGIAGGVGEREHRPPQHRGRRTHVRLRAHQLSRRCGRQGRDRPRVELRRVRPVLLRAVLQLEQPIPELRRGSRTRCRSRPARAAFPSASAARRAFPTTSLPTVA